MRLTSALVALCAFSASAVATETTGFYGSLGGGAYRIDSDGFQDTAPTMKLLGGYDFNQYVALEGAYIRMFDSSDRVAGSRVTIDGDVWEMSTKLSYPVNDRFSAYGKAGWSFYEVDAKTRFAGQRVRVEDDGDDFTWGVGASFGLTDRMSLRGEWSRIVDDADADFLSFNVSYKIGGK